MIFYKVLNSELFWIIRSLRKNKAKYMSERSMTVFVLRQCHPKLFSLTFPAPYILEGCSKINVSLNLYFHTSLWFLKRFYEGLSGLHKTFWGTTRNCKLIFSLHPGSGREGLNSVYLIFENKLPGKNSRSYI